LKWQAGPISMGSMAHASFEGNGTGENLVSIRSPIPFRDNDLRGVPLILRSWKHV
jgi:hypothetical protein